MEGLGELVAKGQQAPCPQFSERQSRAGLRGLFFLHVALTWGKGPDRFLHGNILPHTWGDSPPCFNISAQPKKSPPLFSQKIKAACYACS